MKYYASTPSEEDYSAVSRHVSTRRTSGGYEVRQSSWSGSDAARPETPRDHMTGPLFPTRTPADGDMPDEEGAHPAMSQADPHSIWQMLLGELELEMPSSTFNTWVRDTWVLGYEDGEFLIGLPNAYARDWLENRLRFKIKRALASMMQRQVQVRFQIVPRPVLDPAVAKPAPLYETIVEPPARVESAPAPRRSVDNSQLNPNHTFDTFVVGNYNRLAHAAATAVAEKPGQSYNPLFIYGGVGLGKTHLLHAIGNHAYKFGCSVLYCSSEQFTNELIAAIRSQTTERFRDKYREVGLLLIDDIQFIGGKESTQEEFFHTFNHLHAAGRQVVLSSDRPPKALATLEERLRSRFEGGLLTDISQPDFETRVAILQAKAARLGIEIDPGVLMLVAERVDSNIRELEGALNRLTLQARLARSPLTVALAATILNDLAPLRTACPPAAVVRVVAAHFHLHADDLTGRRRTAEVALARQIAMYLLSEEHDLSLSAIGDYLGGRDHSTIRYGIDQVTADLERDDTLRTHLVALREKIYVPVVR